MFTAFVMTLFKAPVENFEEYWLSHEPCGHIKQGPYNNPETSELFMLSCSPFSEKTAACSGEIQLCHRHRPLLWGRGCRVWSQLEEAGFYWKLRGKVNCAGFKKHILGLCFISKNKGCYIFEVFPVSSAPTRQMIGNLGISLKGRYLSTTWQHKIYKVKWISKGDQLVCVAKITQI